MFTHKFYLFGPGYASMLAATRVIQDPLTRFTGLMLFAHDLFGWFDSSSDLISVKLTSVATVNVERMPLSIRVRHHFVLNATRKSAGPPLVPDTDEYALSHLPWESLNQGTFELSRTNPLVQQFYSLSPSQDEKYQSLVFSLAKRIDVAFEDISIIHDVGLTSAMS